MTPLAGMPSSSVGYLRELLVWSSIKRHVGSVMLQIRREKNQRNMSYQINLMGAIKLWSLMQLRRWQNMNSTIDVLSLMSS